MTTHTLKIKGMGSDHCVMVVKNIIAKQEGASLRNIEIGTATVELDEAKTSLNDLAAAIGKFGYQVEQ